MPGCCCGLEAGSQRLLDQRRLGALALLGDQVELPRQRTATDRACSASCSSQPQPRELDDAVVVVIGGRRVGSSGAGSGASSANSGRSLSGRSALSSCGAGISRRARSGCRHRPLPDVTSSDQALSRRACDAARLPRPVVGRGGGTSANAPCGERRRRQPAGEEVAIGVVLELAGADRRQARDQHQRVVRGSCRISPAVSSGRGVSCSEIEVCDSQADRRLPDRFFCARSSVAVPSASDRRLAVRSSLGAKATRTWQLSRMAWLWPVGLVDLVQGLRHQEGAHAIAGHERQRRLEEVEPAERRELVQHQQQLRRRRRCRWLHCSVSVSRRAIWLRIRRTSGLVREMSEGGTTR